MSGTVGAGLETLLVFDTGLAMPGAGFVPAAWALAPAGITLPATSFQGVGGGGAVTVTPFQLDSLRLGPLVRRDVLSVAGPFPAVLEDRFGARLGGIVSHGFFAGRRVTLDFARMEMVIGE